MNPPVKEITSSTTQVLKVNDILSCIVSKAALGGRLIAYADDGRIIWLDGIAGLNQEVQIQISKVKKRYLEARILENQSEIHQFTHAFCTHVTQCAACPWQELSAKQQQYTLEKDIQRALIQATGKPLTLTKSWQGSYQYWRCTARLHWDGKCLGFYDRNMSIFHLQECAILDPTIMYMIKQVRTFLLPVIQKKTDLRFSCAPHHQSGTLALSLFGKRSSSEIKQLQQAAQQCLDQSMSIHGISMKAHTPTLLRMTPKTSHTKSRKKPHFQHHDLEPIHIEIGNCVNLLGSHQIPHHAHSFMQAHQEGNQALVKAVTHGIQQTNSTHILELYAGSGNLSIAMTYACYELNPNFTLTCLEFDAHAVKQLKVLASQHKLPITAIQQDIKHVHWSHFDHVVLDPPRQGAKNIIESLAQSSIPHITYISCHPAALARDLRVLVNYGYQVQKTQIFDLFPHTGHAEVYVYLSLQS